MALLEWNQRAEAVAERLRVACKGVLEVSRHHHQRLVEQATQWEGWQAQVLSSIGAMAAVAAEQAQAEIAYSAAQIGHRYAAQVQEHAHRCLREEHMSLALRRQQAEATLDAALAEQERCAGIAKAQRDKERRAEEAFSREKEVAMALTEFRDSIFELVESFRCHSFSCVPLSLSLLHLPSFAFFPSRKSPLPIPAVSSAQ